MKRICLFIFLVFITILLSVCAYAHPGNTDSNGGHYNHTTGDYHYHHGREAHDHYDMDGDGDLDCPYEKKQQSPSYSTSPTISLSDVSADDGLSSGQIWLIIIGVGVVTIFIISYFTNRKKK